MLIKKIILLMLLILLINLKLYAKIGIEILPVKCINERAFLSGDKKKAERIIEDEFSKDSMKFNVRKSLRKTLEEIQNQIAGIVKESEFKKIEEVDYFIISSLWEDDEYVIFEIRAMSSDNCKIIYSDGITVVKVKLEKELKNLLKNMIKSLGEENYEDKTSGEKIKISIYGMEEEGDDFLSETVTAMFFTGLYKTCEFFVIEREEARWAVQEKEVVAAGIVNRDPLKVEGKIYDIDLAVEGYVVTKNKGLICYDVKVIDVGKSKLLFKIYDECYSKEEMRDKILKISRKIAEKYFRKLSRLELTSVPSDASLYINNKYWARTPILITDLEKGTYKISLTKQDHENYKQDITLNSGETKTVKACLERLDKKYFQLGVQAERGQKWQTAIEYYNAFSKAYPDVKESIDAKFRIAHICHYELKKLNTAVSAYQGLIKSHSGLWILSESLYGLGCCLIDTGKILEGKEILKKLTVEYPETSAAEYAKTKLQ